ncbi:hypothetical protein V501_02433 [Pseudogymnoascus sp. VKM F-4519 (FW-2642)]|nr:hypothetical protein V501_02433 [Pseudogymnoascus sp. VKM F-4519 (FW-2642)]
MSDGQESEADSTGGDNNPVYQSEAEPAQRTRNQPHIPPSDKSANQQVAQQEDGVSENKDGMKGSIRESRIKDRPAKEEEDSSLKVKIELDLEVEVDLYARVKGDVTIGLM